jgi:3-hydroxyacyl-CoA dehydrogenase
MSLVIRKAAVLGAGVMGAQIAALLAAAGVRTYLLDLSSSEPPTDKKLAGAVGKNFRSTRAILAVENLKQLKPSPLFSPASLINVIPGNFDDDMSVLSDCDWVIEAVVERLDIKQSIHKRIGEYVRPHVPVTTNTSGISLEDIVKGMPEDYASRFFGTHFFNPPRYMRLLEIIPHSYTDEKLKNEVCEWIQARLGKGIVHARDTVNFIANRIGVFATQSVLKHMAELKLNIETVDNLTGPLVGRAKSATLRTMDVVGLDTFQMVARNTYDREKNDPYRELFSGPKWVEELIEAKALGQKSGNVGCYKKATGAGGKSEILAYRPEKKTYEPQQPRQFAWEAEAGKERDLVKRVRLILAQSDEGAQFVWRSLRDLFSYSALLLEDIAGGTPKPLDDALRWGFNWDMGPFELWQALGYDEVLERMKKDGAPLPAWAKPGLKFYDPVPGSKEWLASVSFQDSGAKSQLSVAKGTQVQAPKQAHLHRLPQFENKDDKRVVSSNKSASLVDIGDGVAALVFHSKMNSIDFGITELMMKSVERVQKDFQGLVIANEGGNFSAGANLKVILESIQTQKWGDIDRLLREFQGALSMVKFAPFPTVSCPYGLVLGGGCEVALHTTWRIAAGETYAGLVEIGVGLIPAGGGTKELALRSYELMSLAERGDPMAFLQRAFLLIGMARTSSSGHEALEMGLFPQTTKISLSRDHLTERAKRLVLGLSAEGYVPRSPATGIKVVGDPGIQTFRMMLYNMVEAKQISAYDALIGEKIATVLCGGEVDAGTAVDEQWFLDLERRVFLELCKQKNTADRIEHMLKSGKPLRN